VVKPQITPVVANRDDQSAFMKKVLAVPVPEIQPVFIDYKKDLQTINIANNQVQVLYTPNKENSTFDLYYVFDMGTNNLKKLGTAIDYLPYLGTSTMTPKQVQEEFYKLGCSFNVFNSDEQVYVNLSGLSDNFVPSLKLFEQLLADPKANPTALKNLEDDILKHRKDDQQNKGIILRRALFNYGVYGASNPYTNVLSEKELRALKPAELTELIKGLTSYEHHILYYGPLGGRDLNSALGGLHKLPATLKPIPATKVFTPLPTDNKVLAFDFDMKQAEIIFLSKSEPYNKFNVPAATLFNEYFGGNMGSVVFQELRESKALAYSVSSYYRMPNRADKPCYMFAYIGSQADKLPEAMGGMTDLLNTMPESDVLFQAAKQSVLQSLRSERITKAQILFSYENSRRLGLDYDIRKDIFSRVPTMTIADVRAFQQQYVKNKTWTVLVVGKKSLLDMPTLEKYGNVKFLTKKDIFGY
jgi:predicted Zn-dependent peptidase